MLLTARQLAAEISAFLVARQPPQPPDDPSHQAEYTRAWEEFNSETVSRFGSQLGGKLFEFRTQLKDLGLADAHLDINLNQLGEYGSARALKAIPKRLEFIADHLVDPVEAEILKIPFKRLLTPSQRRMLKSRLTGADTRVFIAQTLDDQESGDYANAFASAFKTAGWKVERERIARTLPRVNQPIEYGATMGLLVFHHKGANWKNHERLWRALEDIGITPRFREAPASLGLDIADLFFFVDRPPR